MSRAPFRLRCQLHLHSKIEAESNPPVAEKPKNYSNPLAYSPFFATAFVGAWPPYDFNMAFLRLAQPRGLLPRRRVPEEPPRHRRSRRRKASNGDQTNAQQLSMVMRERTNSHGRMPLLSVFAREKIATQRTYRYPTPSPRSMRRAQVGVYLKLTRSVHGPAPALRGRPRSNGCSSTAAFRDRSRPPALTFG